VVHPSWRAIAETTLAAIGLSSVGLPGAFVQHALPVLASDVCLLALSERPIDFAANLGFERHDPLAGPSGPC
jgi:hypothetical protein